MPDRSADFKRFQSFAKDHGLPAPYRVSGGVLGPISARKNDKIRVEVIRGEDVNGTRRTIRAK